MEFRDKLSDEVKTVVDACDRVLADPYRLKALEETQLMDSPREEAFDRLARLAAITLRVPLTMISLVGSERQFFKAFHGLPSPMDQTRELPIDRSICRYTLNRRPILADDAANDPLLKHHPATVPWGIGAFMAVPMVTEQGHVLGSFCVVDRVKRKWSQEELGILEELTASVMTEIHLRTLVRSEQRTRRHLDLALASASMSTWHLELSTGTVTSATGIASLLGTSLRGEAVKADVRSLIHPEDVPRVYQALAQEIKNPSSDYVDEFRLLLPDGSVRWVLSRGTVVRCEQGSPSAISGILADITDRKKIEKRLQFERHTLEAVFRESPAAMCLWVTRDLVFDRVNAEFQKLFEGRELLGKPLLEALPEIKDQAFIHILQKVFDTGQPFIGREMLARIANAEGEIQERYFDFAYIRVDDENGQPIGVYNHSLDVTDRVRARQSSERSTASLATAVKDLEEEHNLRERFVAALSHDLRTPLTAAKISAQILARKVEDPAIRKLAARISENMDRADQMLRDLLDASRFKAGQTIPVQMTEGDLAEIAAATVEDLRVVHGERFVLDTAESIPGDWDRVAIRRMIENLAGNAVKYGESAAPITIGLTPLRDEVEITVHNFGTPIPEAERPNLYHLFRRSDSAVRCASTGWGIGLTLVRGLAEAHGGTSGLKYSGAQGTAFSIRIPRNRERCPRPNVLH